MPGKLEMKILLLWCSAFPMISICTAIGWVLESWKKVCMNFWKFSLIDQLSDIVPQNIQFWAVWGSRGCSFEMDLCTYRYLRLLTFLFQANLKRVDLIFLRKCIIKRVALQEDSFTRIQCQLSSRAVRIESREKWELHIKQRSKSKFSINLTAPKLIEKKYAFLILNKV